MSTQDLYEKIEAYLSDSLSASERLDFEAKLQADPALAAEVELMKEMDIAISDKPILDFQKLVQSEGEAFQKKHKAKEAPIKQIAKRNSRFYIGIAASLLFVIASIFFLWNNQSSSQLSGKELFAQHFDTYDLNQNLRGSDSVDETAFEASIQQYQNKDYNAATTSFQQQVASAPNDMVLSFCLANAALNQNPPAVKLAEDQFRKIITNGESIYVLRSKWYLSLILLEKEKTAEAKTLLKELEQSPDNNLAQKAKAVLRDLDS